ncbi:MAG: SH3 domain-containing protein [Elusimicrobia bacterium]|nr:SH3 domain-containing protein [Elusimicrobiota bacterium]
MSGMRLAAALAAAFLSATETLRAEILCVGAARANVREGAGLEHGVAFVTDRHTPFRVRGWEGEWASVSDVDGGAGWLHESVLDEGPCVVLAGKSANVRFGPGLQYMVLWSVEHGQPFRLVSYDGVWSQVTDDDGLSGWVASRLLWGTISEAPDAGS